MRRLHPPGAERDRPIIHRVDAESLEPFDGPYDVEHSIHRPHLVQMHALGGHTVDAPFSLADESECAHRTLLHGGGEGRALDELHELADVPSMRLLGNRKLDLLAPHPGPPHVPDGDAHAGESQPCRQLLEPRGGNAERQQGTERHVTAHAGGRIEDGDAHGGSVEI